MEDCKNVLITGGAGFIGSHLADLLIEKNYNVFIVDNLTSGFKENINPKAHFYNMDINSPDLEKVFEENKINYIFHLAAQANVSFSTKFPEIDATENILGSINILKLAKKYGIKKFIPASTAAVYGVPKQLPVDEEHETTCLSFYGISKITMEKYTQLFGVDYIIFRFANVYGPRQSALGEAGVVAIFADKMQKNQDIIIHGDGEQTRDFVYVADIARTCLAAIESNVKNEIINVSTNSAITINKLYEIMSSKYNYQKPSGHDEERFGDIKHSVLDNSKCIKLLGVKPETSIEDGLKALSLSVSRV